MDSEGYRRIFLQRQLRYEKEFKGIFTKIADDFMLFSQDPNMKFYKDFRFPPYVEKKAFSVMAEFHDSILTLTEKEITDAWTLSNEKNDAVVTNYLRTISAIKTAQKAAYFQPNTKALKAFLSGKKGSFTLSDSVWKIAKAYRTELEAHLAIGITNGDSAQVMSRRVRKYLNDPYVLFRRVRNKEGKLVASKAMKNFHPGQGVYKSSYKNALRLTRTNANQAFLLADHLRWRQMDMVTGVKISLSDQHRIYDICDELWGNYPKEFVFTGWHPQCLCHATPILSSEEDFMEYLRTGTRKPAKYIQKMPAHFKRYVENNIERYMNYKSTPNWIEDNEEIISEIAGVLK